ALLERDARHVAAEQVADRNQPQAAVALKQGAYLRSYVYTLVELLSPTLNRKLIEQALKGEAESYEL
ncbi:transcriptional regulator, partial [Burkholderia cenocepacia]|nr:transcriptional regulator [Burkholderia cenocepacia]